MEPNIFEPNKNRLDEEWVAQPRLYAEYAIKLAGARSDLERAKARADVAEAELDKEIRMNPEKFGLSNVTEKGIKSTITLQREYRKATKAIIEAKHLVDVLDAQVSALDHRKKALEKLVDLRLSDYFSEPRTPIKNEEARFQMDNAKKRQLRKRGQE